MTDETAEEEREDFTSVLSDRPDGVGFYYGHYRGHRIDVRPPNPETDEDYMPWEYFVDGEPVGYGSNKDLCERRAQFFIERWIIEK